MACNCKNTVTSFLGGDVANPTTFLNCGEADGTYNNPLETGKTQCIAENNVLRILDTYKISGTVKNSGQIVFERTFTGDTDSWEEWNNDGTYFRPIKQTDGQLSAQTLNTSGNINVGNGAGVVSGSTLTASDVLRSKGTLIVTGNTVLNGTLSASSINVGNGLGPGVSANTFTAPSVLVGTSRETGEIGVVTGTTVAAKYSGATISNADDRVIIMTTALFRPGMIVELDMGAGSSDLTFTLPELGDWLNGEYIFLFPQTPNASGIFVLNGGGSEKMYGMSICLDGNEIINGADTITFGAGKTIAGTRIEAISQTDRIMLHIFAPTNKADITPS